MARIVIETKKLTRKFGNLAAVDNIDLKVEEGTVHGFIGPNGAGKTTTIKMLVGALNPSSGEAFIKGFKIGSLESKRLIGYSPEHPVFYWDMAAIDYLVYIARICGVRKDEAIKRAKELLKWLELDEFTHKNIRGFSAGMKQKLCLAQAMIHNPEILILDEPTANLDPTGRLSIINKLKSLAKEKHITIFISSHILGELEKLVDFVTILNKGRIVVESDVKSLEAKFTKNHYLLKTSKNKEIARILKSKGYIKDMWIDENDVIHIVTDVNDAKFKQKISEVVYKENAILDMFNVETASLETVFMSLVGEEEKSKSKK